jgi:hypothetical protein
MRCRLHSQTSSSASSQHSKTKKISPTNVEDESNQSILRETCPDRQNKINPPRNPCPGDGPTSRAGSGTIVPWLCARKVILRKLTFNGPISVREYAGARRVLSRFLSTNVRLLRCWGGAFTECSSPPTTEVRWGGRRGALSGSACCSCGCGKDKDRAAEKRF